MSERLIGEAAFMAGEYPGEVRAMAAGRSTGGPESCPELHQTVRTISGQASRNVDIHGKNGVDPITVA